MNWPTDKFGKWIIDNLFWEIIVIGFVLVFLKFLPSIVQAARISSKILKDNRDSRGNSWGKYSADRFIDVWYSNPKTPLRYEVGKFYYKTFNNPNSRHWMHVIDSELVDFGLIKIFDSTNGYKVVEPIKNWRNSLIIKMIKFYLTRLVGDNTQYYKDLEEQSKR